MQRYPGLLIRHHTIKDSASKAAADDLLYNWEYTHLTDKEWMHQLECGKIIILGEFTPNDKGKYTHAERLWKSTHHICADGDHLKGVDLYKEDVVDTNGTIVHRAGDDINPHGIEPWTDKGQLSIKYPSLLDEAYAISESVNSMTDEKPPPHRRFRIIFEFDEPITCGKHYRQILETLSKRYPIISTDKRQPAQPVYGNARKGRTPAYINGKVLKLSDFPYIEPEPKLEPVTAESPPVGEARPTNTEQGITLQEYLDKHNIPYTLDDKPDPRYPNRFFVKCPDAAKHTNPTGEKHAFVWDDGNGKAFHCSHKSCGQSSWKKFTSGYNIPVNNYRQTKPPTANYVGDPPNFTESEIDTNIDNSEVPEFPQELFFGPFEHYRGAHLNRVPMSDGFCFAGLKHVIASILGRKVYIETSPTIYPNTFTALIGKSSSSAKGIALAQASKVMRKAAPNVFKLTEISTTAAFIDNFVIPKAITEGKDDDEKIIGYTGGLAPMLEIDEVEALLDDRALRESPRISGFFSEFGSILRASTKAHGAGILEKLMEAYDATDVFQAGVKTNKTQAKYPTFSMIGASDKVLIERILKNEYIVGGFTNRFEWYYGGNVKERFLNATIDQKPFNQCIATIGELRRKFSNEKEPTGFTISEDAYKIGESFLQEFNEQLVSEELNESMIAASIKRTKTNVLKNALMFATLLNEPDDTVIKTDAILLAIRLAEYTIESANMIFENFATNEMKEAENKVIDFLKKNPLSTAAKIANKKRSLNAELVERILATLTRMKIIGVDDSGRAPKYVVLKEETHD